MKLYKLRPVNLTDRLPIDQDVPTRYYIRCRVEGLEGERIAITDKTIPDWRNMVESLWEKPVTIMSVSVMEE